MRTPSPGVQLCYSQLDDFSSLDFHAQKGAFVRFSISAINRLAQWGEGINSNSDDSDLLTHSPLESTLLALSVITVLEIQAEDTFSPHQGQPPSVSLMHFIASLHCIKHLKVCRGE